MKWFVVLLFLCFAGCSSEPANLDKSETQQNKHAIAPSATINIQARKFSKGEVLYMRNCADCHGWKVNGNGPAVEYMDTPTPVLTA